MLRAFWALPADDQYLVFEEQARYLSAELVAEPALVEQARERATTLQDMRRAHEGAGDVEATRFTAAMYDRLAEQLDLTSSSGDIARAWDGWKNAKRKLADAWVQETSAQLALRRAASGKQRPQQEMLDSVAQFARRPGVASRLEVDYDHWVAQANDDLDGEHKPHVRASTIRKAFPRLRWTEVVDGALGHLDPDELVRQRAQEHVERLADHQGLVSFEDIRGLTGLHHNDVLDLTRRDDFPQPVADIGGTRAWEASDIRRWTNGELRPDEHHPASDTGQADNTASTRPKYLTSKDVADLTGTTAAYIITALYRGYTTVPEPDGRVGRHNYWHAAHVDHWLSQNWDRLSAKRRSLGSYQPH